jgi:mannosyl-glycoprotein endo-beta-N-acetylglucosaminidase
VGANRDPSYTDTAHPWKGMAHYVVDKSVINDLPFVTNFNTGQGSIFAIDGQASRVGEWQNLSLQDILPTWRWLAQSTGTPLYPDLTWDDAYYGGTSLEMTGDIVPGSPTTLMLYKTELPVGSSTDFVIAFRTGTAGEPSHMQVALDFTDTSGASEFLDVGSAVTEGWNLETLDLSGFSGRTLEALGLRFASATAVPGYHILVGRMGVLDGPPDPPLEPSGLWVEGFYQIDDNHATIRLRWSHSPETVYQYNVFRVNPDDSRTFLGATPDNAYFVPEIVRVGEEDTTTVEVVAVGPDFSASDPVSTTVAWTTTGTGGGLPPGSVTLSAALPNPVAGTTVFAYTLPASSPVRLAVFSIDGRLVETLEEAPLETAGNHSVTWDASMRPAGIYFVRLEAGAAVSVRRCVVL